MKKEELFNELGLNDVFIFGLVRIIGNGYDYSIENNYPIKERVCSGLEGVLLFLKGLNTSLEIIAHSESDQYDEKGLLLLNSKLKDTSILLDDALFTDFIVKPEIVGKALHPFVVLLDKNLVDFKNKFLIKEDYQKQILFIILKGVLKSVSFYTPDIKIKNTVNYEEKILLADVTDKRRKREVKTNAELAYILNQFIGMSGLLKQEKIKIFDLITDRSGVALYNEVTGKNLTAENRDIITKQVKEIKRYLE